MTRRPAPRRASAAAGGPAAASIGSQRVDLVDHAGRPVLGEVGGEILLLHMLAEGGDVGLVDLQALALEGLDQFLLAREVLLGREVDRRVGGGLEPSPASRRPSRPTPSSRR